ncbi:RHS repeat domain-containing protein [Ketobacter nezhaii]|uniref:RHS repeat domain-containing protein n=1 Tax=Ketobacter sp. MCCC 1A13808 TaxID=2602738 RepID=UPI0018DB8F04|nr:RHS repeat-associated core domain-containing protein [Ketobacter sp. MCCC 1A13808]
MNKRLTSWLSTSNWQSLGHVRHAANKEIGFINIKAGISTMKHFEIITKSVSRALIILLMFGFAFCSNAAVESITYFTTDHLGSPIMATDHSGAVKWREDYLPYGSQIVKEDTDNSVGFTGHLDEKTLNVTYMQGRWYHPEMGRFLAVDPVWFVESSPMSFNRYAYVNNNPYKYVDPDGRYLDLAVEALSISVGIASLVDNYSRGDYSAAIVDAGGILVDSVLMAVPIFPGASGLGIEATRDGAQIVAKKARKELPSLDSTGKVHGELPRPKDLKNYSNEELTQLKGELGESVQQRIKINIELGSDKAHGQRQAAEQQLIKSIEKHLDN